ncbi:MAG TPA: flavoprotein, partial [Candidatus Krumholzibacteria bacterium]|nr:flavoprotein [Candidatus Krumholzibacteria bacterium]
MSLRGKKILLGVTGGIAAYKSVFLLRLFKKAGADVKVVMTDAAAEFVTPLTFESLSEHPVHVRMFEGEDKSSGTVSPIEHIDLARWPDVIVVAPATQNTLAGLAHGRADDLLATVVSAYRGPV